MPQVSFNFGHTTRLPDKYVRKTRAYSESQRQQGKGGANHSVRCPTIRALAEFHLPPLGDKSLTYIDYFFKIGEPVIVVVINALMTIAANCYINSAKKDYPKGDVKITVLPGHNLKTGELYQGRRVILYSYS